MLKAGLPLVAAAAVAAAVAAARALPCLAVQHVAAAAVYSIADALGRAAAADCQEAPAGSFPIALAMAAAGPQAAAFGPHDHCNPFEAAVNGQNHTPGPGPDTITMLVGHVAYQSVLLFCGKHPAALDKDACACIGILLHILRQRFSLMSCDFMKILVMQEFSIPAAVDCSAVLQKGHMLQAGPVARAA